MKWIFLLPLGLVTACLQPPSYEQNFGEPVAAEEIEKALNQAPQVSPFTIQKGEFTYWITDQYIENLPGRVIQQRSITVTDKKEYDEYDLITLVTEIRELINGDLKPSRSEQEFRLPKNPNQKGFYLTNTSEKISFYNLKVRSIQYPTPPLVTTRPDCGGLNPCPRHLPAQEISFDQVKWSERGGDKTSFQVIYSDHVPFFAHRLKLCIESKIDYQGNRVKVKQCETVEDFIRVPPLPPSSEP